MRDLRDNSPMANIRNWLAFHFDAERPEPELAKYLEDDWLIYTATEPGNNLYYVSEVAANALLMKTLTGNGDAVDINDLIYQISDLSARLLSFSASFTKAFMGRNFGSNWYEDNLTVHPIEGGIPPLANYELPTIVKVLEPDDLKPD